MTRKSARTVKGEESTNDKTPAEFDIPTGWECTLYCTTGSGNRVADFEHDPLDERVTIRPWKTYDLGGFPDAHRVVHHRETGLEVIATGLCIGTIPEAEAVADTAMRSETLETDR